MARGLQLSFVAAVAVVLCGSTLLLFAKPHPLQPPRPADAPVEADYGVDAEKAVALFESRVVERQGDFLSRTVLGELYVQKAKRTEDGTYFDKAREQFAAALRLHPGRAEAKLGLATVAMANHEFEEGLRLAEDVWNTEANQLAALAMMGDAHFELGDYAAATESYDLLSAQLMTAPVQARLSRLAEMQGRVDEAIDLMHDAWRQVRAVNATGRDEAWYVQRLGELMLSQGRRSEARALFRTAHELDPSSWQAIASLGDVAARSGEYDDAERLYWLALETTNDAGLYAALGDLRAVQGRPDEADAYYDRAADLWNHSAPGHDHPHSSHGHGHASPRLPGEPDRGGRRRSTHSHSHANPDAHARTLSQFLSARDREPARAVELARLNLKSRQDVYSYDALAWALFRTGELEAAADAAAQALRQGTRDATLWYHAGAIHAALGDREAAIRCLNEVMAIDPRFSVLHAESARRLLNELLAGTSLGGDR